MSGIGYQWPQSQRGVSLIELLVSMLLGMTVIGMTTHLVGSLLGQQAQSEQMQQVLENARMGLQLIQEDIQRVGAWAGYVPAYDNALATDAFSDYPLDFQAPFPCQLPTQWTAQQTRNLLRMPVQSFATVPSGCESVLQNVMPNSSIVVVRFLDTSSVACDSGRILFQPAHCALEPAASYQLARSGFDLLGFNCQNPAPCYRYRTHLYFVRKDRNLMRAELNANGLAWSVQPLVEQITRLDVEWGIDNRGVHGAPTDYQQAPLWLGTTWQGSPEHRGDGVADEWLSCAAGCAMSTLLDVSAVKIQLTAEEGQQRFSAVLQENFPAILARRVLP